MITPKNTAKRLAPKEKTTITKSNKKKRVDVMPKIDDSMVSLVDEQKKLVDEQKKLVQLQIEKVGISIPSDRAKERAQLIQSCEEFVEKHPLWSRERIITVFPEFETIIDLIMED
jgi:hypothetical protein